jgi:hypothetical protein
MALGKLWHAAPLAGELREVAQKLMAVVATAQVPATKQSFDQFLTTCVRALLSATGRRPVDSRHALGQAIAWLSSLGLLDSLRLAFVTGDEMAAEETIIALVDALRHELQSNHRRYILARYCSEWNVRRNLARQYLAKGNGLPTGVVRSWEITDNIDEILERSFQGERLVAELQANGGAHRE